MGPLKNNNLVGPATIEEKKSRIQDKFQEIFQEKFKELLVALLLLIHFLYSQQNNLMLTITKFVGIKKEVKLYEKQFLVWTRLADPSLLKKDM